jgi:hypothetical protein
MFKALCFFLFSASTVWAAEAPRSKMSDPWWIEASAAISPDSGVFHAEDSAVGDRKDLTFRYQPGILGLVVNIHGVTVAAEKEQERYDMHNMVFGLGFTFQITPFGEGGSGFWGGTHLIGKALYLRGRSDYHVYQGPSGGAKTEVAADISHANGVEVGVDGYFPVYYGLWLTAGTGFESLGFSYSVDTDPNDDGKVNMRATFIFLRAGLAFSF